MLSTPSATATGSPLMLGAAECRSRISAGCVMKVLNGSAAPTAVIADAVIGMTTWCHCPSLGRLIATVELYPGAPSVIADLYARRTDRELGLPAVGMNSRSISTAVTPAAM